MIAQYFRDKIPIRSYILNLESQFLQALCTANRLFNMNFPPIGTLLASTL